MELRTLSSAQKKEMTRMTEKRADPFATLEPLQKCGPQQEIRSCWKGSVFEDQYLHIRQKSGMKDAPIEGAIWRRLSAEDSGQRYWKMVPGLRWSLDSPVHIYVGECHQLFCFMMRSTSESMIWKSPIRIVKRAGAMLCP